MRQRSFEIDAILRTLEGAIAIALSLALASLFVGSSPALAQGKRSEADLAIRMEVRDSCVGCRAFVLGYFRDGSSYFRGIDGVRALSVRGTFWRRDGFYLPENLAEAYRKSTNLDYSRASLDALVAIISNQTIGSRVLRGNQPLFCRAAIISSTVDLRIHWGGTNVSTRYCMGTETWQVVRQMTGQLMALYEYPDDYLAAPSFQADSNYFLRFARLWEQQRLGAHQSCEGTDRSEYILQAKRDGSVLLSYRIDAGMPFETMSTMKVAERVVSEAKIFDETIRLMSSARALPNEGAAYVSGTAGNPYQIHELQYRGSSAGDVIDLSPPPFMNPPPVVQARIAVWSDLTRELISRFSPRAKNRKCG